MGQLYSSQRVNVYWIPGFVPQDPLSQSTALAVAQGARTPGALAQQTSINLARAIFSLVLGAILFFIAWLALGRPALNPRRAETFAPREEADETWVRL